MNAFLEVSTAATTPEETFLKVNPPAVNPEKMTDTLIARSLGLVGALHAGAKNYAEIPPEHLAVALEQVTANLEMLNEVLEDVWHGMDKAGR